LAARAETFWRGDVRLTDSKGAFASKCLDKSYNAFLFSVLGDGGGPAPLSVLSALTRLGVDPWEEAAELSRMNAKAAGERLAGRLATLPGHSDLIPNLEVTAHRLVDLIPRATVFVQTRLSSPRTLMSAVSPPVAILSLSVGCLIVIVSLLMAQSRPAPMRPGGGPAQSAEAPRLDRTTPAVAQ